MKRSVSVRLEAPVAPAPQTAPDTAAKEAPPPKPAPTTEQLKSSVQKKLEDTEKGVTDKV